MKTPQPWDRRPKESSRTHHLFHLFLRQGRRRSLEGIYAASEAYEAEEAETTPKGHTGATQRLPFTPPSLGQLRRLSSQYDWIDRAQAWDTHLDRVAEQVHAKHAVKQAERRIQESDDAFEVAQKLRSRLREMLMCPVFEQVETSVVETYEDGRPKTIHTKIIRPSRWTFRDAATIARISADLVDFATSLNPQRTATQETIVDSPRGPMFIEVDEVARELGPPPEAPPAQPSEPTAIIEPIPEPSPPTPTPAAKPDPRGRPPGSSRPSFDPMLDELTKRKL